MTVLQYLRLSLDAADRILTVRLASQFPVQPATANWTAHRLFPCRLYGPLSASRRAYEPQRVATFRGAR